MKMKTEMIVEMVVPKNIKKAMKKRKKMARKMFNCNECNKKYVNLTALRRHMLKHGMLFIQ